jgi:hypothetical protein
LASFSLCDRGGCEFMTGAVTQRSSTKAFIVCVGCVGGI